jgi:hypothetical protein
VGDGRALIVGSRMVDAVGRFAPAKLIGKSRNAGVTHSKEVHCAFGRNAGSGQSRSALDPTTSSKVHTDQTVHLRRSC